MGFYDPGYVDASVVLDVGKLTACTRNCLAVWFLPTHTWFSGAFQRPQQLARGFADAGNAVVYYEPWGDLHWEVMTKEGLAGREFIGLRHLEARLALLRCPATAYANYVARCKPDALIMLWPDQARYIPKGYSGLVVYEVIDDHSLFPDKDKAWHDAHEYWVDHADLVVATADDLYDELVKRRADTVLAPNAVRLEDWSGCARGPAPPDMQRAREAPVVVGYYGALASWFDRDLWAAAADARPDWAFVLIGYYYDESMREAFAPLLSRPNVHYLGVKAYAELKDYLAHFDVATIPFVLNAITHACSPVKLFEYMAGGKPIVTTRMREVLKYKSVLTAGTNDFLDRIEDALRLRGDAGYIETLAAEARANTWRARAQTIAAAIRRVKRERAKGALRRPNGKDTTAC